ncbi:MAG: hypothetical protein FD180_1872 [Planctomycetota bacterium]|nr:MAG: hypothetical protein FD180_1872 [Planctomycetota bacterium]
MRIERGSVALVRLDPVAGHEQSGLRPCVVISNPDVTGEQRYPVVRVVPVTGTRLRGRLYPGLAARPGGLRKSSCALADQARSIDKRRITRLYGAVSEEEQLKIDEALILFLGLGF